MILFENDSFIVVNKPNGVEFHGEKGILNSLRVHYKELYGVHRLDKETSGIILFAKTKNASKMCVSFLNMKYDSKARFMKFLLK